MHDANLHIIMWLLQCKLAWFQIMTSFVRDQCSISSCKLYVRPIGTWLFKAMTPRLLHDSASLSQQTLSGAYHKDNRLRCHTECNWEAFCEGSGIPGWLLSLAIPVFHGHAWFKLSTPIHYGVCSTRTLSLRYMCTCVWKVLSSYWEWGELLYLPQTRMVPNMLA